jgi:adenylylsulfate kinase
LEGIYCDVKSKRIIMITRNQKERLLHQNGIVIWLTGLSGSGKTTIAHRIEESLFNKGCLTQILDGDNIRNGLNCDLGFSEQDREENIRRVAEVSKLFINSGIICINSFISPTHRMRQMARDIIGSENFIEIFLNASLEVCEKRDVKGMYKDAREGKIKNFTGIDSIYEIPVYPDIELNTEVLPISETVEKCLEIISPRIKRIV